LAMCAALSISASACLGSEGDTARSEPRAVGALVAPVVGGESIEACEWPSTVSVNAWGACTGTLIHRRVVTTAAHCIEDGSARIYFGAGRNMPGAFSLEARCEVGADGTRGANSSRDWAYCILPEDERVTQIPITPPLVGCEAEAFLMPGQRAWVVGFGTTSARGQGAGTKRQVEVVINALEKQAQGTLDVGDAAAGACHGDSGGPLYVHLIDGEHDWGYRVVGSTSGAGERACDCSCSTVYVNIENHVKAIEDREGIDVTPCTDAQGNFDPSPECQSLMTAPQQGNGAFPGCQVARTTEPINSCGVLPATALTSPASDGGSGVSTDAAASAGADAAMAMSSGAMAQGGNGGSVNGPASSTAEGAVAAPTVVAQTSVDTAGSAAAAGRAAIASATFSSTAAGRSALPTPSEMESASVSGSCQVALPGRRAAQRGATPSPWLAALGLCALAGTRRRGKRRLRPRT